MTFIITLIALVIERFFHWSHLRHWRWFVRYQQWLANSRLSRWPASVLLLMSVLPLVLAVAIIYLMLDHWLYGLFRAIFGVIVLVYCLGPTNLWVQVYDCLNALNKEDPKHILEKVNAAFDINTAENSQSFHLTFTQVIFQAAYQRVFAVTFWFVILGPAGAVLYRLIELMSHETPLALTQMAKKIRQILDWVPVRLFTLLFAFCGRFMRVFNIWKRYVLKGLNVNDALINECGIAALDVVEIPADGAAEKEVIGLLDRVFTLSLVILLVVVLLIG